MKIIACCHFSLDCGKSLPPSLPLTKTRNRITFQLKVSQESHQLFTFIFFKRPKKASVSLNRRSKYKIEQVCGHYCDKTLCYLPSCICFVSQPLIPSTMSDLSMQCTVSMKSLYKKCYRECETCGENWAIHKAEINQFYIKFYLSIFF